jgi:alkylation response protein AidB-like acyl-CoA dehydrogenase
MYRNKMGYLVSLNKGNIRKIAASLAKSFCSEAYFHCAAENIQIHGGIGFTWEHHAHLYFKRAKSSELFMGDPAYHRELLAERLGI